MSIDLVDEKFGKVEQPRYEEGRKILKLGVLGNDFSVLCNYDLIRADVWVMKEYRVKESWIKLYTFKYPNDLESQVLFPPICMSSKVLRRKRNSTLKAWFLLFYKINQQHKHCRVQKPSLKSDSWRTLDNFQGGLLFDPSAKLVNEKFHWATMDGDGWGIMSIDLADDKYWKMEQPLYGEGEFHLKLGVLGSDLSVLYNYELTQS
uniref:F-box protein CPR30-like n=1 Tax=Nicotiana tabacum TaxID=4097 RepID=A0A1S4DCQ6_TOBAC|nr:PREDICTED: uncharacterized protein LOC107828440 [Nicotiana tabacum]XP_016511226.1 PREDICTED: uncharacterized protein LOC107828440 [Nicotiana tabacum]XP_016511227.1 PREDICTED: uncharacterized protein LOC107828440 [Nicotiana tabacum]